VAVRRTAHGVRFDITLDENSRAKHAHGWLMRGERLVAAFGPVAVHDHRFVAKLPTNGRPLSGRYELVVAPGGQGAALEQVPVTLA
jgi:hypothetical protein